MEENGKGNHFFVDEVSKFIKFTKSGDKQQSAGVCDPLPGHSVCQEIQCLPYNLRVRVIYVADALATCQWMLGLTAEKVDTMHYEEAVDGLTWLASHTSEVTWHQAKSFQFSHSLDSADSTGPSHIPDPNHDLLTTDTIYY